MILSSPVDRRDLTTRRLASDLVIVGGGLSGTCAAITAARAGLKVVLMQDRPVLGGNASSEVRLWILGATSHLGNNNRWSREGGVIDEILLENVYRNPEGNPVLVDALLLEKVSLEPNITLLLNTAAYEVEKDSEGNLQRVRGFCAQNSTRYDLTAPLFCDASGDGILGFLSGAAFRMGAEAASEFGEKFAPTTPNNELLGHSLYFYSKNVGRPVRYTAPQFAIGDIKVIPRFRDFNTQEHGCKLWWIEFGGRLDTVHETETIKWELWKVVYGVWDHIKNSGLFPEAENLTLEWVGQIPGKRESRRFEGDYIISQQDIVQQKTHEDAVGFGGWAIDLHPADGVFSEKPGCAQWHSKGVYQIPYRCLYSRNVGNLFLAGRIISASHIAFGSTRVMATCAYLGQAVGMAAALCKRESVLPRALLERTRMTTLQRMLLRTGQHIPGIPLHDPVDLGRHAQLSASSEMVLEDFPPDGPFRSLGRAFAMLLPVREGRRLDFEIMVDAQTATNLRVSLRTCSRVDSFTPDILISERPFPVSAGEGHWVRISFDHTFDKGRYAFVCFAANSIVTLRCSQRRVTGVLSLCQQGNGAVSKGAIQQPDGDIGIDAFEFWLPERRPGGHNIAMRFRQPLWRFGAQNLRTGFARPTNQPNAWVADFGDAAPAVKLTWKQPVTLGRVELGFDSDFDHPLESVLMGHPERVAPFCVRRFRLTGENGAPLTEWRENHLSLAVVEFPQPVTTAHLTVEMEAPSADVPAALLELRCYAGSPA